MATFFPTKRSELAATPILRRLERGFSRILHCFEERRRIHRTIAALSKLSDQSLTDLGIIRYEIPIVAHRVVKGLTRK